MNVHANTGPAIAQLTSLERAIKGVADGTKPMMAQIALINRGQAGFGKSVVSTGYEGHLRKMDNLTKNIQKSTLTLGQAYDVVRNKLKSLTDYHVALNAATLAGAESYGNSIGKVNIRIPEIGRVNSHLSEQGIRLQTAGAAWELYGKKLRDQGKNIAFMGRQVMLTLSAPMALIGGALATTSYQIDQQLTEVAKVYGGTESSIVHSTESIREAARDLSRELNKNYGVAQKDTLELAGSFARLGETGADLDSLADATARLMRLGDVPTDTATKLVTVLRTTFEYTKEELSGVIDMMNIFENTTTLSMEDFAEGLPRMAAVVKTFGGDIKDAGILMETFTSRGIDAVEGANSLKTIAAKIARPTKQVRDLWNEMTRGTQGSFDEMAQSFDNNVPKVLEHIQNVQDALDVENTMRQRWAAQLAGAHQYSKYLGLAEGLANPTEGIAKIKEMSDAEFKAYAKQRSDREIEVLMQSASAQFQQAWNNFKMWAEKAGEAILPIFTTILNSVTAILSKTMEFGSAVSKFLGPVSGVLKNLAIAATAAAAALGPLMLLGASTMMAGGTAGKWIASSVRKVGQRMTGGEDTFLTQQEMGEKIGESAFKHINKEASRELADELNKVTDEYVALQKASLSSGEAIRKTADQQVAAAKTIANASAEIRNATKAHNQIVESPTANRFGENLGGAKVPTVSDFRKVQETAKKAREEARLAEIEAAKAEAERIREAATLHEGRYGYVSGMRMDPITRKVTIDPDFEEANMLLKKWTEQKRRTSSPVPRVSIEERLEADRRYNERNRAGHEEKLRRELDERRQREYAPLFDQAHERDVKEGYDAFNKEVDEMQKKHQESLATLESQNKRIKGMGESWQKVGHNISRVTAAISLLGTGITGNNKALNTTLTIVSAISAVGTLYPRVFGMLGEAFAKNMPVKMSLGLGKMTGMLKSFGTTAASYATKFLTNPYVLGFAAITAAGIGMYRLLTSESRKYNEETEKIAKTADSYADIFGYTKVSFGQLKGEDGEVVDTEKHFAERLKEEENTAAVISRIRRNVSDAQGINQILSIEASKLRATGATPEDVENAIKAMLVAANVPIHIKEQILLDFSGSEFKAVNEGELAIPIKDTLDRIFANNQITDRTASGGQQFFDNAMHYQLSKDFAGDLRGGTELLINEFKSFENAGEEGGKAVALLFSEMNDSMSKAWLEGVPENVRSQTDALAEALSMNRTKGIDGIESLMDDSVISGLEDFDQRRLNQYREKMWALSRDLKEAFGGNDLVDWMFSTMDMDIWSAAVGEYLGLVTMSATEAWDAMNRMQSSDYWTELTETQKMTAINTLAAAAGLETLTEEQLKAAISGKNFGISLEQVAHVLGIHGDDVDSIKEAYEQLGDSDGIDEFIEKLAEILDLDIDKVREALDRLSSTRVNPDTGGIEEIGEEADEATQKVLELQEAISRGAKGDWSVTVTIDLERDPASALEARFNQIFNKGMKQTIPYEISAEEIISTRKDIMSKAWGDVMDEMAADAQIQIDAQKRAFRDAQQAESEAMSERHSAATKALSKQQAVEKKSFSENWKRRIDDENKMYEDRIAAIEKTQEVEDDLERIRKRNAERETRRLKYQQSLMQTGIELNIAMAGGDLDEVARLNANAIVAQSNYEKEATEAELGYQKEDADRERRDKINAIKEEQKLRIESLEEQRRMEEEAMQERLERQREELAEKQKAEQKYLARKQEDQNIANEIQFQARQRSLNRELEALRNHIPKNEKELADSSERVQKAYDDHGGLLVRKSDGWAITIRDSLDRRTREATENMSNDAMWRNFGNRVAEGVSRGAFDMSASEFQKFLRTGDMPSGGGGGAVHGPFRQTDGSYRHDGGPIGIGSDKYNSRGGIPLNAPMRSDEQHVLAQHGEYMMNRNAHQMYGTDAMHAVNSGKAIILRHEGGPIGTEGFGPMGAGIQAAMIGALVSRATLAAGQAAQQASMMGGFGGMGAGIMGDQPGGGTVRLGNISGPGITTPIQQAMWDTIRTNVPHSVLVSATRTVQTEGHPDNHNMGRAIDLVSNASGGMQQIARWIAANYPNSAELIHSPFGHNIKNGRNVGDGYGFYGAGTMAGHADHVHWAMTGMTPPAKGGSMPGMASSADIEKKFPQYSGWTTVGIQKYGQNMAAKQMEKWGVSAGGAMYGKSVAMPFIAGNQQDYIRQIVGLAKARGMGPRAAMIALMTAMQESNIRVLANPRVPASYNFPHDGVGTDHDSVGIFQQRPHWGPVGVLMNPAGSAGLFYNVLSRYNYNSMDPGAAAQAVQVSAYPHAYSKWQGQAASLVQKYYDEGGIASGKGLMLKNTLAPERVLSPRQTEAFEQLIPLLTGLANMGVVDYDETVYAVARDVHATARQIETAARSMEADVINAGTEINVTINDATIVGVDELDKRLDEWGKQIVRKIEKNEQLKERRLGGR